MYYRCGTVIIALTISFFPFHRFYTCAIWAIHLDVQQDTYKAWLSKWPFLASDFCGLLLTFRFTLNPSALYGDVHACYHCKEASFVVIKKKRKTMIFHFMRHTMYEIKHFLSFSSLTRRLWPSHLTNWCSFSHLVH